MCKLRIWSWTTSIPTGGATHPEALALAVTTCRDHGVALMVMRDRLQMWWMPMGASSMG